MEHEHENHTHHEGHADTFPTETEGLLQEYSSTLDKKEALLCVQELQSPVSSCCMYCYTSLLR